MLQKLFTFSITLLIVIGFNINTSAQLNKAGIAPYRDNAGIEINNYKGDTPNVITTAYGNDANNGRFVSIPVVDGVPWTEISTGMTDFIAGADMDNSGNYYGAMFGNITDPQLASIDVTTGAITVIGPLAIDASQGVTSLAYNSSNDTWYLGTSDPFTLATSMLYSVDITTGATTLIGTITNLPGLLAMAIDCDGNAYGIDATGDNLVSINLSDATGSIIGSLGVDVLFAQDADFDPANGTLYWAGYELLPPFDEGGTYRTIDLTTGVSTEIVFWGAFAQLTGFAVEGACDFVPVELTSFSANVVDGNVSLSWSTATETNNSGFEIQRKTENSDWNKIAFVPGFGTSTEQHSYSYTDQSNLSGMYSYRLKQIDYDGTYDYSEVVLVDIGQPLNFALQQNFPNPFNPSTVISYSIPNESFVSLTVYNAVGEVVTELVNEIKAAGNYEVQFNASNLASGMYLVRMQAGNFISIKKMTLMK